MRLRPDLLVQAAVLSTFRWVFPSDTGTRAHASSSRRQLEPSWTTPEATGAGSSCVRTTLPSWQSVALA